MSVWIVDTSPLIGGFRAAPALVAAILREAGEE
jgi:hypothetical protein